jgi:hypothetical protein
VNQGVSQRRPAAHPVFVVVAFCISAELFAHFKAGGALSYVGSQEFKMTEGGGDPF